MSSWKDVVTQVLNKSYNMELNWERYTAPFQGASLFFGKICDIIFCRCGLSS